MLVTSVDRRRRDPWNKGKLVGQKAPLHGFPVRPTPALRNSAWVINAEALTCVRWKLGVSSSLEMSIFEWID